MHRLECRVSNEPLRMRFKLAQSAPQRSDFESDIRSGHSHPLVCDMPLSANHRNTEAAPDLRRRESAPRLPHTVQSQARRPSPQWIVNTCCMTSPAICLNSSCVMRCVAMGRCMGMGGWSAGRRFGVKRFESPGHESGFYPAFFTIGRIRAATDGAGARLRHVASLCCTWFDDFGSVPPCPKMSQNVPFLRCLQMGHPSEPGAFRLYHKFAVM